MEKCRFKHAVKAENIEGCRNGNENNERRRENQNERRDNNRHEQRVEERWMPYNKSQRMRNKKENWSGTFLMEEEDKQQNKCCIKT